MNTQVKKADNAIGDSELMEVLKNSLYPGANDDSIRLVIAYCKEANLDIMQKPVHIVPMYSSKERKNIDTIMPGIGLYRTQAEATGQYAGLSDPEFGPDIEITFDATKYYDRYKKEHVEVPELTITVPEWCKMTAKRLLPNGETGSWSAIEYWTENYATMRNNVSHPNAMWKKRGRAQLVKCTESQVLRKAFPGAVGAAPTAEEMEGKDLYSDNSNVYEGETVTDTVKETGIDDDTFNKVKEWARKLIEEGKNIESILKKVKLKHALSEKQENEIRELQA